MKNKKLTFAESLLLVAGAGMGTGMLTIPYAVSRIGLFGTLTALVAAYAVSALLYLMIAELTLNSKRSADLLGILDEHLFRGKGRAILRTLFFILLILLLLENLVVYIRCAANVLGELFGIPAVVSMVIFYVLASVVIFFGMKGMGIGEKISVLLIGGVVLLLAVLTCFSPKAQVSLTFGAPATVFAVYGLFMFAFSAIFSVIQVCNHIDRPALAGKAVLGGLTLNAIMTLGFAVIAVIGSEAVTEIAIFGLADGIGIPAVKILCSVLVLLAMLTSFWSSGFAFADVVGETLKLSHRVSWFISTLTALLLAVILPLSLLDFIQIGAGALSVILVLVVLPAYTHAVRAADKPLLGKPAQSKLLLGFVAAAILLMAISSLIPIP
ncbi:MAG: hypothetical protein IJX72_05160 [Clostridia bacterium]|nr:hypothetical protein [Clostridia bacterium]